MPDSMEANAPCVFCCLRIIKYGICPVIDQIAVVIPKRHFSCGFAGAEVGEAC